MQLKRVLSYPNDIAGDTSTNYQYTTNLLAGDIDPKSNEPSGIDCGKMNVYTSPLRRAVECIDTTTAASTNPLFALREIPFDLTKYCSLSAFNLFKQTAVNQAFIRAFMANNLFIPHRVLQEELELALELKNKAEEILAISHTFRICCLVAYEQIGHNLFLHPEQISDFIKVDENIMGFGDSVLIL